MTTAQQTTETATALTAKVAPPASISIATLMGVQVSELVLWATLIYTLLLICQKIYQIYKDVKGL